MLYPFVNNKLVPDIAFMIGPIEDSDAWTSRKKVDILFLLRDDKESIHFDKRNIETIGNIIRNISNHQNRTFALVDWRDHSKFHNVGLLEKPGHQLTFEVQTSRLE